jgi:hypothetical protein
MIRLEYLGRLHSASFAGPLYSGKGLQDLIRQHLKFAQSIQQAPASNRFDVQEEGLPRWRVIEPKFPLELEFVLKRFRQLPERDRGWRVEDLAASLRGNRKDRAAWAKW